MTVNEQTETLDAPEAARRNTRLRGGELASAANALGQLSDARHLYTVALDRAGERLIGAALASDSDDFHPVAVTDPSGRFDAMRILVVGAWVAEPDGIVDEVVRVRSLGAVHVEVAVVGGCTDFGADVAVTLLPTDWSA